MAFDFDPKALPEWLRLPAFPRAPSMPTSPWLAYLPWLRRAEDEDAEPTPGERPITIGQRIARMYGPPAASVPNAPAGHGSDAVRSQQDSRQYSTPTRREGKCGLASCAPSLSSLTPLPSLPSLPSLPRLTRTANMQREKPKESTGDMDE